MNQQPASNSSIEDYIAAGPSYSGSGKFFEGASACWLGWQFLRRHPRLWRFAILPMVINLVITLIVLAALVASAIWFIGALHPWMMEGQTGAQWWLWLAVEIGVALVLILVCGAGAVLTWKLLSGVLCGYFYGILAEQAELELGTSPKELSSIPFRQELADTLLNLSALATVSIFFTLIGLFPLVGGIVALAGGFSFNSFILGLDQFGYPLALRGRRRVDQFHFARQWQGHTLGMGAAIFLFQLIPLLGAVFATTSVVGAVILHKKVTSPRPQPQSHA